jgi:chemotaxis protein MotB
MTQQQERQGDEGQKTREVVVPKESAEEKKAEETAVEIAAELEAEVSSGKIEVETQGKKIIIRIRENGAFKSGSDYIDDKFLPVIDKIREVLVTLPGLISVEGHTDDIPSLGGRFRSNWALSSARAAAFAEELFIAPEMGQERFQVVGHGDVRPLVENTNAESRARNRRVEIIILQTTENDDDDEPLIDSPDEAIDNALNAKPEDFELDPNDIF